MPNKTTAKKKVGEVSKQRLQKEKKKESSTGKRIAIFLIVMVFVGLSIGILFSPAFNLSKVVIEDGVNVTAAEISNILEVSYGENIFKQNYKDIKHKILSLPYIASAKIAIHFPDKIKITYKERTPYAVIKFLETFFMVDKQGYLLESNKENINQELPLIYGIDIADYELGNQLDDVSGLKYKNIIYLLETIKQKNMAYTVNEIDYSIISEVKLWIKEADIEIVYGEIKKDIAQEKLNRLSEVLKTLIGDGKTGRVDISNENIYEKIIFTDINNM